MTEIGNLGRAAWRDFTIADTPSSGRNNPSKSEIRDFVDALDERLDDENDIVTVTTSTRLLLASDNRKYLRFTNALGATCYVPAGLPASFKCVIEQGPTAGPVVILKVPESAVTVDGFDGLHTTAGPRARVGLHQVATNDFTLAGNLDEEPA